jgi:DNA-binding HxlR family transcriptional regulator
MMRRLALHDDESPLARGLERIGDTWSLLILREALDGVARFEQFQTRLRIAPNILSRRLRALERAGLLARNLYTEHPPRYEYQLTARGADLRPVLLAISAWGARHFTPAGDDETSSDLGAGAAPTPRNTPPPARRPAAGGRPGAPVASAEIVVSPKAK